MSEAKSAAPQFATSDKLAFERTRLAYERTMMAWIRTATALIAFGFGMYKLFEFAPLVTGLRPGQHVVSPRAVALVLAFLGNLCLLMAAIQHRTSLQALRALGLKAPCSAAAVLAAFLALFGISVLLIVLFGL
jgi:putative membrane protein